MSIPGFFLVLALPFAEIATFILVGREIGLLPTLALTILGMVIGLMIVRAQGLSHLGRLKSRLEAGQAPVADLLHSILLLAAGFLFLIPGLLTDALALLLLLPPVRALIGLWIMRNMTIVTAGWRRRGPKSDGSIIEGEYTETDADPANPPRQLPPDHDRR